MALMIELPPEAERTLRDRAADGGVEPSPLASQLVQQSLAPTSSRVLPEHAAAAEAARQMFAEWEAEDPVTGPDDLREREREFEEFKAGMNAASLSGHPVNP